jgi:sporulation protein YabP
MHRVTVDNCNKTQICGVTDVISFDLNSVILETECGMLEVKGNDLHVSRLSVEKGEVDVDGRVVSMVYSEVSDFAKGGASLLERLFK